MSEISYRLVYFNLKGRAEVCRLLFTLANQKYEEVNIAFEDWPTKKETLPFGQAPVLEVTQNGKTVVIAQSHAIERFLANKFNLFGKDDIERARIDMIIEQVTDLFNSLIIIYRKTESEEKKQELEKALTESVPKGLKLIQNLYEANNEENPASGYLVGDKLTYADITLVNFYDWLRESRDKVLKGLPRLEEHFNKIRNLDSLKQHYEKSDKVRLTILFPN